MSIVDKDARHGAKSDEKRFTGYKVNSIMSGRVPNSLTYFYIFSNLLLFGGLE